MRSNVSVLPANSTTNGFFVWDSQLFGPAAFNEDDLTSAREHCEASLHIREEIEYPEGIELIDGLLKVIVLREGDHTGAFQHFPRGLMLAYEIGARWLLIYRIANVVLIAAHYDQSERAVRLSGFVESMSDVNGALPIPIIDVSFQKSVRLARAELSSDDFDHCHSVGRAMTREDAIHGGWNSNTS